MAYPSAAVGKYRGSSSGAHKYVAEIFLVILYTTLAASNRNPEEKMVVRGFSGARGTGTTVREFGTTGSGGSEEVEQHDGVLRMRLITSRTGGNVSHCVLPYLGVTRVTSGVSEFVGVMRLQIDMTD